MRSGVKTVGGLNYNGNVMLKDDRSTAPPDATDQPHSGRSVGLTTLLVGLFPVMALCTLFDDGGTVFGCIVLGGLLLAWVAVLAVAAVTKPPRPLAEESILAERVVWCVRAAWAAVVITTSSVVSLVIALQVQKRPDDPSVWRAAINDSLGSFVGPVAGIAAFLASCTIPVQLKRAGRDSAEVAARRLVKPLRENGVPSYWLERLIREVAHPAAACIVCYLGPLIAFLVATKCLGTTHGLARWSG